MGRRNLGWSITAAAAIAAGGAIGCGVGAPPDAAGGPGGTAGAAITVCGPTPAGSSCASTCSQAQALLTKYCVACHQAAAPGGHALGDPLNDILNIDALDNVRSPSPLFTGWAYIAPGDPAHSLIYRRVAVTRDMPRYAPDQRDPEMPTASDFSVLHDWIASCVPGGGPDVVVDGTMVSCPSSPPSGACPAEGLNCPYDTESCVCAAGSWTCTSCPLARPAIGDSCGDQCEWRQHLARVPLRLRRCRLLLWRRRLFFGERDWECGGCPASAPGDGQACGNTSFSCAYGDTTCTCGSAGWRCLGTPAACPVASMFSIPGPGTGYCHSFYACQYPVEGQTCTCPDATCSCPVSPPSTGGTCAGTRQCAYGDQTCSCTSGGWQCSSSCPATAPPDGSACSSSLSCAYDQLLCYCGGTAWHCS